MILLLIFLFGLCMGSFLHALADRLVKEEPFVNERSHCDHCNKTLQWYELVPLFSFLSQKGKCRHCHTQLTYYYPVTEVGTGILFTLLFILFPLLPTFIFLLLIASLLLCIAIADAKYGLIPFPLVILGVVITLIYFVFFHQEYLLLFFITGIVTSLGFFLIFAVTKGKGMGFGDVVYAFLMGFLLGFPGVLIGLYMAVLTGAGVSSILILLKKKKLRGDTIAFGPFLVLGTIITLLWSSEILSFISRYILYG